MKKLLKITLILFILTILFVTTLYITPTKAYSEQSNIGGQYFYIKNAYSGKYLDVYNGIASNGTNVQQFDFNGGDNQKWFVSYVGDGLYQFGSMVGSTISDGNRYLNYALDMNGAVDGNGVNLQIWQPNTSSAQRFALEPTANRSFIIRSAINFNRAITIQNQSCSNEGNAFIWQYNASHNDEWILEPVTRSGTNEWFGIYYAQANANKRMTAYPDCSKLGGDCANFVSQCMLATGIHFENEWYTYRKNGNYSAPSTVDQSNNSWNLADPSPWISAKQFEKYWTERKKTLVVKGSEILSKSNWYEDCGFYLADAIQVLSDGFLGLGREAVHTMYITGIGTANNGNKCFTVSYHSTDRLDVNLLDIIDSNKYYKFYAL